MPTKRDVLAHLSRDELLAIVDRFELALPDRRAAKEKIIEAVASSHKATLPEVLAGYSRDRLKELCRAVGVDDSGKEKAAIVERLAGAKHAAEAPPPGAHAATAPAAPKPPRKAKAEGAKNGGDLGFERTLFLAADKTVIKQAELLAASWAV